jgi:lipid-A-disaccharide synthase-like uncharacterized protein
MLVGWLIGWLSGELIAQAGIPLAFIKLYLLSSLLGG